MCTEYLLSTAAISFPTSTSVPNPPAQPYDGARTPLAPCQLHVVRSNFISRFRKTEIDLRIAEETSIYTYRLAKQESGCRINQQSSQRRDLED